MLPFYISPTQIGENAGRRGEQKTIQGGGQEPPRGNVSSTNMELTERRLKSMRVLHGLKQSELAKAISRSQAWVSLVETGKLIPQPEQLRQIRKILSGQ